MVAEPCAWATTDLDDKCMQRRRDEEKERDSPTFSRGPRSQKVKGKVSEQFGVR